MRQLRALVLMGGALMAIGAVSYVYLRPAAAPEFRHYAAPAPIAAPLPSHLDFTGRTDGGYFDWHVRSAASGGHGN